DEANTPTASQPLTGWLGSSAAWPSARKHSTLPSADNSNATISKVTVRTGRDVAKRDIPMMLATIWNEVNSDAKRGARVSGSGLEAYIHTSRHPRAQCLE